MTATCDALDRAIDVGMDASDLYDHHVLPHSAVRDFLAAAIAAWLKEQAAELNALCDRLHLPPNSPTDR